MAQAIFESRGAGPRRYRNALAFLAADATRMGDLEQAVRQWLAWRSIENDIVPLDLSPFQANQARTKRADAEKAVEQRIPEAYVWLLVPAHPSADPSPQVGRSGVEWQELRLQGNDPLAVRAARKMCNEDMLITTLGPTVLRMWLDRIPLWRGDHVGVRQLADDFAQYLYLPRLRDSQVLLESIQHGINRTTWELETFAYAESYDEERGRYRGLRAGEGGSVTLDSAGVIVKPDVARRQLDAEQPVPQPPGGDVYPPGDDGRPGGHVQDENGGYGTPPDTPPRERKLRRFHGSKQIDTLQISRDAGLIANEIVQHLAGLLGSRVRVTIEIDAELPDGAPEHIVRTVTENACTLRFESAGFEEA